MRATDFVDSYFSAWNHHDPERIADHLADDGVYCDVPENARRTHDELITSLDEFFTRFRHRYELLGAVLANHDTIAFQYRMIPASGDHENGLASACNGAEFITLQSGAAMTITDYYDMPGIARPDSRPSASLAATRKKYAKSGLGNARFREYKRGLESVMRTQQAFRQPDLTLPKLAALVGCSANHLSQVINSGFGMSFFEYLNTHRIQLAKDLLLQPEQQLGDILDIAFAVGFNSNSAFYAAFRKHVGQTPARFRQFRLKTTH